MTPEALAAELAPIRLPGSFARFGLHDALAALALGLVAALVLSALLRVVTERRARPVDLARARIASLGRRDMPERIAGLAALLHAHGGAIPAELSRALYDPAAEVDPAPLERAVIAAARRTRRP